METTTESRVLIFKTDIGTLCPNCAVHKLLDSHPEVESWSLDTDDTDCVLRVISATLTAEAVSGLIAAQGHLCTEL